MLTAPDPVHDRHGRSPPERWVAGRGERDRGGPRVHVRGRGGVVAVEDLGGEVAGRAEQPPGVGELGVVGDPGQAEVDEDRRAALHQHVGRLHVAVQHADRVHRRDPLRQAGREPGQVLAVDRPLLVHVVVQREAGHVARRDVGHRRPRVRVDDLGDPLALDPAQRPDLAGQPAPRLVVADDVRPEHLQRDPRAVAAAGEVDHAHAALADLGEQRVAAHGPRGGCRRSGRDGGRASRRGPRRAGHADQTRWRALGFHAGCSRAGRAAAGVRQGYRDRAPTRLRQVSPACCVAVLASLAPCA